MQETKRKKRDFVRKRKNFLPTLIATVFLWTLVTLCVFFVDPESFGAIFLVLFLFFWACLFTFSILFVNTRRGFLISLGITIFLILRILGIGNILNAILILLVLITFEVYFLKQK